MTKRRRKFSDEFKREAVRLVTDEGYTFAEAGKSLGIRGDMISRWKRGFERADESADREHQVSDKQRIKELEAEVRKLRMEKDILKNVWSAPIAQAGIQNDIQSFCVNVSGLLMSKFCSGLDGIRAHRSS